MRLPSRYDDAVIPRRRRVIPPRAHFGGSLSMLLVVLLLSLSAFSIAICQPSGKEAPNRARLALPSSGVSCDDDGAVQYHGDADKTDGITASTRRQAHNAAGKVWDPDRPSTGSTARRATKDDSGSVLSVQEADAASTKNSGPTLVSDPAKKADEGSPSDSATTAADVALPEVSSIKAIHIPFVQRPGDWRVPGHGISLDAKGEAKSGTTWIGRLIPHLSLQLCGGWNNLWCEMGGLKVIPNVPAPRYEFEMMTKSADGSNSPTLFLHFMGGDKHLIPGMDVRQEDESCHNGGIMHKNGFEEHPPCMSRDTPTRQRLVNCLWNTSTTCLEHMISVDPEVRRTVVIVRDPRNVVMSERKMRIEYYKEDWVKDLAPDAFVRQRFEILVSWTHQRWVWHTATVMKASSHVVIYEDIQETHLVMIDLAAFIGLECSEEQAKLVLEAHRNASPHGDFTTHGLQSETIAWMNATMARLLPEPLAHKWGLKPTDL